jgi:type II secretion system protein D
MDVPSAAVSLIYDPEADQDPWVSRSDIPANFAPPAPAARRRLAGPVVQVGGRQAPGGVQLAGGQPPAPQPGQPIRPPVGPPGTGLAVPRGPATAVPFPELGIVVLRTGDQQDLKIILDLIEQLQKDAAGAETVIELVPLKHADSSTLAGTLNSLFGRVQLGLGSNILAPGSASPLQALTGGAGSTTQNAFAVALPRFNAVLVAGPRGRMPDIRRELDRLDQPNEAGIRHFALKRASASVVARMLQQLYAQRFPQEGPPNMQFRSSYDTATNTVLVQAAPADMRDIEALIGRLDAEASQAVSEVRIFKLRNALAEELGATLVQAIASNVINPTQQATQPWFTQTVTQGVGALGQVTADAGGQFGAGQAFQQGQFGQFGQLQQFPGGLGAATGLNAVIPTVGASAGGGVSTKTNALRFFSSRDGQAVESGFLEDVHVIPNVRTNALVVTAPERTMKLIERLIDSLDTVAAAASFINVFQLQRADAALTAQLLAQLFSQQNRTGLTPGAAGGQQLGGQFGQQPGGQAQAGQVRPLLTLTGDVSPGATLIGLTIGVDDRTNSLIVAGSQNDLDTIRAIVARLDAAPTGERLSDVYRLRNQAAADVAQSLQTFFTNALTVYTGAQFASAYIQLQRNVVVVAEPVSNTLLVSASPQYFAEIRRLIERIDAQPPQVAIQVQIAEVQLNNTEEFGVEVGLQSPVIFGRSVTGTAPGTPGFNFNTTGVPLPNANTFEQGVVGFQGLGNLNVGRTSTNGLGFGGLVLSAQGQSFNLLIRALKAQGRVDILSRPQVTVVDNQIGYVQVGQDFPYLGASTLTATGVAQQNIEYRPIGVTMRVTPRVNPDGKVLMRVEPQISSVAPGLISLGNGITQPAFNVETVETTVLAADGETVVLGGLISKQDTRTENGIPFFKDIPYVGALFRYRSHQVNKREVLIIMTPHIIRTEYDAARVLAEESRRIQWCLPDVAKIHGHGMEVLGPASRGADPIPVPAGPAPGGAYPPGPIYTGPGPLDLPGGAVVPPGGVLPPGAAVPTAPVPLPVIPAPGGPPPEGGPASARPWVPMTPGGAGVQPAAGVPQPPQQPPGLMPIGATAPPAAGRGFTMSAPADPPGAAKDGPKPQPQVKEDRPWNGVFGR